jgi:transcriptional regulator with XRE-family HTH domain
MNLVLPIWYEPEGLRQHASALFSLKPLLGRKGRKYMNDSDEFGGFLKTRRIAMGLTQRLLARKLGVEASHIAFIEGGRRRPSLKLVARIADILRLDRQEVLVRAHPDARAFIGRVNSKRREKTTPSWKRFINNHQLLVDYGVTDRELRTLEHLSLLGTVRSTKEFLAILTLIRDIPTVT